MKFLYKYPSRQRPDNFFRGVENIYINSRNKDFMIMATLDSNDPTMTSPDVIDKMKRYDKLYHIFGESANKIHAVNRDMEKAPLFDVLITMSDDMVFVEDGYDEIIMEDIERYLPNGGILHYDDGNRKDIATMCIMTRDYYESFGYIYYPGYQTWYADEEFTKVAKRNNKYKFIDRVLYRHLHYQWKKSDEDDLYKKNDDLHIIAQDKNLFLERCGY